jgi:hypothetical protein
MGKKGKKGQAGKPKKLTPKDIGKRLDTLAKKLEEETKGADLFAPLPPTDDCAICLVPLSRMAPNSGYFACCGNLICVGCVEESLALIKKQNGKNTCAFCREPQPSSDREYNRQLEARALKNDHMALMNLGLCFMNGSYGLPQDDLKALDYWIRAVEHGSDQACTRIGNSYDDGHSVAIDKKRAALFERVGALRGDILALHNIGISEYDSGNHEAGIRHWKIAAEGGSQPSLDVLKKIYNDADGEMPGKEFISKEYLESTYRACHKAQMEVKSEEREKHRRDVANVDMKC